MLIGRERELIALRELFEQVEHGRGQVVGIVGEPGAGKSRLLLEFRRRLDPERAVYVEGRCLSNARSIPYVPVVEIVRHLCGITDADTAIQIVGKVRETLNKCAIDIDDRACYLLWLLAIKGGTESLDTLSPEAIKERTFETVRQLSFRLSQRRPLILVVEDLQWVDKTSEDFFGFLADALAGMPVLAVSTYRSGYLPRWLAKSYATQIALPSLSPDESLRLVRAVLHLQPVPDPLAQLVLSRAEGNPFFIEELARAVRQHGDTLATQFVPNTVEAVLMARIDRLPSRSKQLLQTAAVLGREFPVRLLAAMWHDEGDMIGHLRELVRREFLYEQSCVTQDPTCAFTHALTQEVAYDSLVTSRRRELHTAAGTALERLYGDRIAEMYDRLAYHYSKAGEALKAIEYLTHQARKAARGHSHFEAVAVLTEALAHAEKLPIEQAHSHVVDLVLRKVKSLNFLGQNRESLDLLLEQQDWIRQSNNPSQSAPFYFSLGVSYGLLGDQQRASDSLTRSINEAQQCGDERVLGRAFALQTLQSYWSGHPREGIEYGQQP